MRVCFISRVVPAHSSGGMEEHLWRLARGYVTRGHQVSVITSGHPQGIATETREGIEVHYLMGMRPGSYQKGLFFSRARRCFEELDGANPFDIVHSQSFAALGLPGRRRPSKEGRRPSIEGLHQPLVATLHGVGLLETPFEPAAWQRLPWPERFRALPSFPSAYVRAALMRRFAARVDCLITDSDFSRGLVARWPGVDPAHLHRIYPGMELDRFYPLPKEEAKARLGLRGGVVFSLGRLVWQKGVQVGIAAFRGLAGDDLSLLIGGAGPYRPQLEHLAEGDRRIRFLGRLPDAEAPLYFSAADVFVYPELTSPAFGMVAAEAMACGTPVVGSHAGAIPEVLGDGGLVFPRGDASALRQALRDLLAPGAEERRAALGAKGRRRVEERFTLDGMVEATLALYQELVNGG